MKRLRDERDGGDRVEVYIPPLAPDLKQKNRNEWRQWQWRHVRELFMGSRQWISLMLPEQSDVAADLAPLILRYIVETIFLYDARIAIKLFSEPLLGGHVTGKKSPLYRQFSFLPHYDEILSPVIAPTPTDTYLFDECLWYDKETGAPPSLMAINSPFNLGACMKRMRYPIPGDTEPLVRIKVRLAERSTQGRMAGLMAWYQRHTGDDM